MSHIAAFIIGFITGLYAPRAIAAMRRWWNPAKCEICGGVPYAVHCRATIADNGEMGEPQFVMLCEMCHLENQESLSQELGWEGDE